MAGRERAEVLDSAGEKFGELDFRAPDHVEVVLNGGDLVRVAKTYFAARGEGAGLRLKVRGDDVFLGKSVTTIDGIELGRVVEVVRGESPQEFEALIVAAQGEATPSALPLRFVREVSAHIVLEPAAEEVEGAQAALSRSPRVRRALARARGALGFP